MIQHPVLLPAAFVALAGILWRLSDHPAASRIFRFLPVPFWCYFLPMLAAALGLFPLASPAYGFLSQHLLPVCLVLLLLGADLPAIARLGPLALGMMLAGSAGTVLGGLASFRLYQRWLPEGAWGAVGALAGSWTGGSANLLAVKEALQVPDSLIGPIILVDAAIAYTWMALLIGSSGLQDAWDQAVRGTQGFATRPSSAGCSALRGGVLGDRGRKAHRFPVTPAVTISTAARLRPEFASDVKASLTPRPPHGLLTSILLAIVISLIAQCVGQRLPTFGAAMGGSTWTVLLVTTVALALSMTPLRNLAETGGSTLGTFLLYVLLCSIGARGDLSAVGRAPVFLLLGVTWILIHGLVLLAAGYFARAPLGLIATASQANVGGPISAPIVGATFSRPLASVGLLMAILGNVLGTYVGLATALIARAVGPGG